MVDFGGVAFSVESVIGEKDATRATLARDWEVLVLACALWVRLDLRGRFIVYDESRIGYCDYCFY